MRKSYFLGAIFTYLLLFLFGISVCPLVDERYTQHNLIKYYLFTTEPIKEAPRVSSDWYFTHETIEGSNLTINAINFTGIQNEKIECKMGLLEEYIMHYPDSDVTMSATIENNNGATELRITHFVTAID